MTTDIRQPAGEPDRHVEKTVRIVAGDAPYREVNLRVRAAFADGAAEVELTDVCGLRYLGCGLSGPGRIVVRGTPGNDLAAFMNGPEIVIHGNAQDGLGNTMNSGRIVVHGDAGDVLAHSMRGGTVLVRGNAGYRSGIHMKSFRERRPTVVVGGTAGDYLGEYMAGGLLVVLGLGADADAPVCGIYTGTGMHGGKMILAGDVPEHRTGREVGKRDLTDADRADLERCVAEYVAAFGGDAAAILARRYVVLTPVSRRPYGQIYVY